VKPSKLILGGLHLFETSLAARVLCIIDDKDCMDKSRHIKTQSKNQINESLPRLPSKQDSKRREQNSKKIKHVKTFPKQ
jgi:hypothetical protein